MIQAFALCQVLHSQIFQVWTREARAGTHNEKKENHVYKRGKHSTCQYQKPCLGNQGEMRQRRQRGVGNWWRAWNAEESDWKHYLHHSVLAVVGPGLVSFLGLEFWPEGRRAWFRGKTLEMEGIERIRKKSLQRKYCTQLGDIMSRTHGKNSPRYAPVACWTAVL